ncbi:MAG: translocation/assembly module TamB domain-containing protein [Bauldia sp.]|nr:translocation/assembly module TamB domain-containing protein [Bauldia sp.]
MRRALRYAGFAIVGLIALVGLLLVLLATPPGRAILAGIVERAASTNGLTVSIGSLTGWPPFAFGADKIVASDAKGVFAEIDGLEIDLDVGALLTANIAFDAIGADRISFVRTPELEGGDTTVVADESDSGGGGLFPISVDRLAVARLELGEALIGHPAALAVDGAFALRADGGIHADLKANRLDNAVGTVAALVDRADGAAPIAVDLTVEEGANGILVGLMGRDAGPGYRLAAQSSLSDGSLTGAVSLTSDGDARFAGRFGFGAAGDGQRLTVTGEGDLAELVPPGFADLLSGNIDVAVDAEWSAVAGASLPRVVIHDGKVSTGAVSMTASGVFGGADTDLALKIDAAGPNGGALTLPVGADPLHFDSLSLNGRIAPGEGSRRLDLIGRIAGLSMSGISVPGIGLSLAVEAEGDDPLKVQDLPFAVRVEADAINMPAGNIVATDSQPLLVTADGSLDVAALSAKLDADLSAIGGRALFSGNVSPETATGETRLRFADIAPLSPLAGRDLAGSLQATINGRYFGADGIRLAIEGTATDLDPGEPSVAPLLAGKTQFALTVSDDPSGRIAVQDLAVNGEVVTLTGNAALAGEMIDADLAGSLSDLALVADQSSGAAKFTAKASGAIDKPTFDVTVAVADGALVGQPIADATIHAAGEPVDSGWHAALALGGSFAGRPLKGTAEAILDVASGRFALPEVDLAIAENRITGAIEQVDGGLLSGSLSLDAPNLATLAALALVEASGSADAKVRFQPDGGKQAVDVAFNGRNIAAATVVARKAEGNVRIADALGTPEVDGDVDLEGISAGSFRIDTARMSATVDGGNTRFEARAKGPDLNVDGAGSLTMETGGQLLEVSRLTGNAYNVPIKLNGPLRVRLGDQMAVERLDLALSGGRITASGPVSPKLGVDVTIDKVSLALANQFSPGLGAQGTLSGKVRATGTTDAPAVAWQIDLAGFGVAQTASAGLPALGISAKGDATLQATTVAAKVSGAGATLDVTGRVPFSGGDPEIRAQGTVPLNLVALFVDREIDLGGTARLDLQVASATSISGTVGINDATFIDAATQFGVRGVGGQIRLKGQTASIDLKGQLAQGGAMTAGGTVEINPAAGLPANLKVSIKDGRYVDGKMVDATFSAALTVTGPVMTTGKVGGRVDIAKADILLPDSFGGGAALDVRHVNTPPGFVQPIRPAPPAKAGGGSSGSGGLALGITVATTNRSAISVRGFGLDAGVGGSVEVTGNIDAPVVVGAFELSRGRIEVLGKRFDFTTGKMTFTGDLVPVLDFEAETRTAEITAIVNVDGPADDPQISFSSKPDLPEEEVISQILFNRTVGNLSAFQAAQLVDAIGQFTGAFARGDGIFARVRKMTGLDDIDVRDNDAGGTTVGVGKRINDKLRVGVEQDTGGEARITIDLDITRNLKARGTAGDNGSGSLGLNYEYEY